MPRGRKKADSGSPAVIVVNSEQGSAPAKRGRAMGRAGKARSFGARFGGRKKLAGRAAETSYKAISSDLGVQVGCFASEALFSLLGTGIDFGVESTETTADDMLANYGKPILGNLLRYASGKYIARKHAGLAMVFSAGASSWNGQSWGTFFRKYGVKAATKILGKTS